MVAERRRVFPSLSVRENLAVGGFGLDRGEVDRRVQSMLELFPRLRERERVPSFRLSGGEQRMVSIGRALVTGARVVVLDDPLSAVDTLTERRLVKRLRPALAGRTVLVATQRLSTVELADRAVVLVDGGIVESGIPRDLLRAGGPFAELFADEVVAA